MEPRTSPSWLPEKSSHTHSYSLCLSVRDHSLSGLLMAPAVPARPPFKVVPSSDKFSVAPLFYPIFLISLSLTDMICISISFSCLLSVFTTRMSALKGLCLVQQAGCLEQCLPHSRALKSFAAKENKPNSHLPCSLKPQMINEILVKKLTVLFTSLLCDL